MIRSVPKRPLTFALTRFDCFEASISQTSPVAIPLARASERIGVTTRGSSSFFGLLKSGTMSTGAITPPNATKAMVTIAPQIHQVRESLRTTAYSAAMAALPRTAATASPLSCSPRNPAKLRLERP